VTEPMINCVTSFISDFVQVSRPGWWLVTMWLYIAPCRAASQNIDISGLLLVLFPINVIVYGINDAADLNNDLNNDRKGNFIFGPRGWSKKRLMRVLLPAVVVTALALFYWGYESMQLPRYISLYLFILIVNYLYNFCRFRWKILLVLCGYASITVFSFWRHSSGHGSSIIGLEQRQDDNRWYMAGCNQEYWIHLTFLLVRSQLWTELLDYESDRQNEKWTTLSRLPSKLFAQILVLSVLLAETLWCWMQYSYYGRINWLTLVGFSVMGCFLFVCLEYIISTKDTAPDLTWLAITQNIGGIYLLYDCWQKGVFVQ